MASMSAALQEVNHNGLVLTPGLIQRLEARTKSSEAASAALTASSTAKKRKAPTSEPAAALEEIDDHDPRLDECRWTCNQIRTKINSFIQTKEMKVGEFQRAIQVSSRAYYDFLKRNGSMEGEFTDVYSNAHRFFAKRELQGVKPKRTASAATTSKKVRLDNEKKYDVSGISLPGEEEGEVQVFDNCDEVRKKIRVHLRASEMTRTAFCREISKTFRNREGRGLQTGPLNSFLSKRGPKEGNTSLTFYAAYVFFEKLRIRDGKPKSQFRLEMEDVWSCKGGFDRTTTSSQGYICHVSERPYVDDYGRVRCGRRW